MFYLCLLFNFFDYNMNMATIEEGTIDLNMQRQLQPTYPEWARKILKSKGNCSRLGVFIDSDSLILIVKPIYEEKVDK